MEKLNLSWDDVKERAEYVANLIIKVANPNEVISIFGVPRGGIQAAHLVCERLMARKRITTMEIKPEQANFIIDDIIDTGKTEKKYVTQYTNQFYALVDYQNEDQRIKGTWIFFPWERMMNDDGPVENVRRLLEYIGEDPEREGLKETPDRVIKSYEKLFGGYKQKPADVIKVFEDDTCDEMVIVKNIEFYSTCEHHMLPFFGKAHIAYIPNGKVIGISKLIRIMEIYTRRLNIQERICQQITEALQGLLNPLGVACVLEATHLCMTARGVEKQNSIMVTSSLTGAFKEKGEARSEFMSMIKK